MFEVEIAESTGVNTHFSTAKGLNHNVCKRVNFLELGSSWMINVCLTAAQKDPLSFSSFFSEFLYLIGGLQISYTPGSFIIANNHRFYFTALAICCVWDVYLFEYII